MLKCYHSSKNVNLLQQFCWLNKFKYLTLRIKKFLIQIQKKKETEHKKIKK